MKKCYMIVNDSAIEYITPAVGTKIKIESNKIYTCLTKLKINFTGYYCVNKCGCIYYYTNEYTFNNDNDFPLYDVKIKIDIPFGYKYIQDSFMVNGKRMCLSADNVAYIPVVPAKGSLDISFKTCTNVKANRKDIISRAQVKYCLYGSTGKYFCQISNATIKRKIFNVTI